MNTYLAAYRKCPNETHKNMVFIRNTVKSPNIQIGEFTYYEADGDENPDFEHENVLYNFPGHGYLKIGKFCSIASGTQFLMGAANHSIKTFSSYPFSLIGEDWEEKLGMSKKDMPHKGDTVIGNDVWIGRDAKIMPGVQIGNGAVIGSFSVVAKHVPAYSIVVGNPGTVVKMRFDEAMIEFLEAIRWWDFEPRYLEEAIPFLSCVHLAKARMRLTEIWKKDVKEKNERMKYEII